MYAEVTTLLVWLSVFNSDCSVILFQVKNLNSFKSYLAKGGDKMWSSVPWSTLRNS